MIPRFTITLSNQDSMVSVQGKGRGNLKCDREIRNNQDCQASFKNRITEVKL